MSRKVLLLLWQLKASVAVGAACLTLVGFTQSPKQNRPLRSLAQACNPSGLPWEGTGGTEPQACVLPCWGWWAGRREAGPLVKG